MKVELTAQARGDLHHIRRHITRDDPRAAARTVARIRQVIRLLGDFPRLGAVYEDGPERRMPVSGLPYSVYYEIDEQAERLDVLAVPHDHQRPPRFA